jgi:hypothetical protein
MLAQKSAVGKTAFVLQALNVICIMSNTPAWHMRSTIRFFHKVDPDVLRARMQRVIDRHPALRTTYHLLPDQELDFHAKILMLRLEALQFYEVSLEAPVEQRVHPTHNLEFKVVDAREWSPKE